MNREQERAKRRPEKNPVVEYNKIQNKYYPELFAKFAEVNDPRNQSYIEYPVRVMLGTMYYKCISGISSMQEMTLKFNDDAVVENLYSFMSEEKIKQDCESKAFIRLAEKIKKRFPRLPIIITADGLYVSQKVIQTCTDNGWNYIIRYKEGSASFIAKEYQSLPEKEKIGSEIEYQNQIMFQNTDVNLTYYTEKKIKPDEKKETTEFAWIADITITKNNARKIVNAGRNRWKIENQGFNRQKHWQGNIEHACSWNEQAQKNHYLMEQIADFIKQLYEYFYLAKNEIKKLQKIYLLSC